MRIPTRRGRRNFAQSLYFVAPGNHDLGRSGVDANPARRHAAPAFSGNPEAAVMRSRISTDLYSRRMDRWDLTSRTPGNVDKSTPADRAHSSRKDLQLPPRPVAAFREFEAELTPARAASVRLITRATIRSTTGGAHILVLDANPHLFNGNLPNSTAFKRAAADFCAIPTALRAVGRHDLDSASQCGRSSFYHQAAFTSGDATIANGQMRAVAKYSKIMA